MITNRRHHQPAPETRTPDRAPTLLLTPAEAARELRIHRATLYDLLRGDPPALTSITIGRARRISRAALERYIALRGEDGGGAA